jgi:luciferase family oxidoreductase group 1
LNVPAEKPVLYSILDLSAILQGSTAAESFRNTLALARHAEALGYHRYWVAEHHNLPGIASSATSVLIGYIAGGTSRIRVGSGGIMLPNHAPLVIAEQFGTLASMYPGRIDLGLGRAPGGDQRTARALRRGLGMSGDTFPQDLAELRNYFQAGGAQGIQAIPGSGLDVPIYLLGSSDFSARLAAELGLPFAFASHFAPDYLLMALQLYRANFQPSATLATPYVIVGVSVYAADTGAEAERLFTSLQQRVLMMIRNLPGELPPPVDSMNSLWTPAEEAEVGHRTYYAAVGSPETVRDALEQILKGTDANELMITGDCFDQSARLHSYEIAARVMKNISGEPSR